MTKPQARVLGTFTLAMMTMAAIVSLRNLSLTAELGSSSIFFLILAAVVFFIPIALVTAELAAAWPRSGGCYVWVGEAFGKPLAFVALWCSWMASVSWFPAVLAFTAAMFANILQPIFPGLENNTYFILIIMLSVFWVTTLSNFWGIKFSGIFSSVGVVLGTLIPGLLIVGLGLCWIYLGNPTEVPLNAQTLIPDFKFDNLALFSGVLLSLAGVELAAFHIRETKDPQHSYPRAMLFAILLILVVYILGTMAIVVVVPHGELLLASGLIQAFSVFFSNVGMDWAVPLIALFLFVGTVAGINTWIIGPAKGLLVVAEDGFFPAWLQRVNKHGVPTSLLTTQAVIGSVLSMLFLYIRNNSSSIWFLTALSAQFTCLQYILVFCACLKLRYSQPKVKRVFKTPVIWLVSGLGLASCVFSFLIVYVPHAKLVSLSTPIYCLLLIGVFAVLILPTLLLVRFHVRSR